MFLTAIWNMLSTGKVYNPSGYLIQTPRPTPETKVLTQNQAPELLRLRGYVIMDDPSEPSFAWLSMGFEQECDA